MINMSTTDSSLVFRMHLLFGTSLVMRSSPVYGGISSLLTLTIFLLTLKAQIINRTYHDHLAQIINRLQNARIKLSAERHPALP